MGKSSGFRWEDLSETLGEGQAEVLIEKLGLIQAGETETRCMVFCPFHNNKHDPAATFDKSNGYFWCFNSGCSKRMPLIDLVQELKNWDFMTSKRFIKRHQGERKSLDEMLKEVYASKEELPEFPADTLKKMQDFYNGYTVVKDYVKSRGITEKTAEHFGLGYDPKRKMVITPVFDTDKRCVGIVGRTIMGQKRFQNSKNLPARKTLFNIQNAKYAGSDTLILVESNFDALRIHQAGYPNVCATLGGTFSEYHLTQLNRHFNKLILMIDGDDAGQKFAETITKKVRKTGVSVWKGKYSEGELFPHGAKDASDCTDKEIAWMIRNADLSI